MKRGPDLSSSSFIPLAAGFLVALWNKSEARPKCQTFFNTTKHLLYNKTCTSHWKEICMWQSKQVKNDWLVPKHATTSFMQWSDMKTPWSLICVSIFEACRYCNLNHTFSEGFISLKVMCGWVSKRLPQREDCISSIIHLNSNNTISDYILRIGQCKHQGKGHDEC